LRIGRDCLLGGDLADLAGEGDVFLGHPLDLVLRACLVPVDRVLADQLQVDTPPTHMNLEMICSGGTGLADGGEEPGAGAEVADDESGVQSLTELAPVTKVRGGYLISAEHVHGAHPPAREWYGDGSDDSGR